MKNNIKKISWIRVTMCMLILGISLYFVMDYFHEKNLVSEICSWEKCFTVELARTESQQQRGLMNRTYMAENSWMVFVFDQSDLHSFWMENTLIPLDMLRIDDQFTVVHIVTAQPCKAEPCQIYTPDVAAKYVLEINAGIAAKYKIVEWSVMRFRNINE